MSAPHREGVVGDDVFYHFSHKGALRSRPAKIVSVIVAMVGQSVHRSTDLVVFFDGPNDGRTGSDLVGWEAGVRQLAADEAPAERTWSHFLPRP